MLTSDPDSSLMDMAPLFSLQNNESINRGHHKISERAESPRASEAECTDAPGERVQKDIRDRVQEPQKNKFQSLWRTC